jgi:hypothetical protein
MMIYSLSLWMFMPALLVLKDVCMHNVHYMFETWTKMQFQASKSEFELLSL